MSIEADRLIIRTVDPNRWLELSDAEPKGLAAPVDSYVLTIQLGELRASTRRLDAYNDFAQDGRRLTRLFAEMSKEWRGWKGEKIWRTTDAAVTLAFTHDGVGHVRVNAVVKDDQPSVWEVRGQLAIELGALDRIARDMAQYFRV